VHSGFRLDKAQRAFGDQCAGLEASDSAVAQGAEKCPQIDIRQGIARQDLNLWSGSEFDVIVVGHLLYLMPRCVLFEFAAQVDSLLADNGHLIVVDFVHHRNTVAPYAHHYSLLLYKGDPPGPWSWNP
jgi:cyclopropane fatty-acyl-phospholipid synthase-like methyltransferase